MSYILDALQKSEAERRRGEVPDINRPLQMAHGPRRKRGLGLLWLAVALLLNAVVLAVIFWPGSTPALPDTTDNGTAPPSVTESAGTAAPDGPPASTSSAPEKSTTVVTPVLDEPRPESAAGTTGTASPQTSSGVATVSEEATTAEPSGDKPTLIVPSTGVAGDDPASAWEQVDSVPSLNEMPLSFQRGIPDLRFSSHVYASEPGSRRVMINGHYLRPGDRFSGVRVDGITENGVVLFADGKRFQVGVVRNWSSPQ